MDLVLVGPTAQLHRHGRRAAETLGGFPSHGLGGNGRQQGRYTRAELVGRRRVVGEHRHADLFHGVAAIGLAASQQFIEHDAQGVDVGPGVHGAALQLFRRQVVR